MIHDGFPKHRTGGDLLSTIMTMGDKANFRDRDDKTSPGRQAQTIAAVPRTKPATVMARTTIRTAGMTSDLTKGGRTSMPATIARCTMSLAEMKGDHGTTTTMIETGIAEGRPRLQGTAEGAGLEARREMLDSQTILSSWKDCRKVSRQARLVTHGKTEGSRRLQATFRPLPRP